MSRRPSTVVARGRARGTLASVVGDPRSRRDGPGVNAGGHARRVGIQLQRLKRTGGRAAKPIGVAPTRSTVDEVDGIGVSAVR